MSLAPLFRSTGVGSPLHDRLASAIYHYNKQRAFNTLTWLTDSSPRTPLGRCSDLLISRRHLKSWQRVVASRNYAAKVGDSF